MTARHGRLWWGFAATVSLIAAACNSSTGPQAQLSNPQALSSDLQTVSSVFVSPTFQSFGAVGTATGSPAAGPAAAGALLGAAPIVAPRSVTQPYAGGPARLQALRRAASSLSSGISASVIPPAALGKTFMWDANTHQYVADPTATPAAAANGVRIILYQVDASGNVIEPPVAVGFVDLLDESSGNTNALHVILRGGTPASPGTTYADYTVTGTVTGSPATAFTATAAGYVSDGTRTLSFTATFSATNLTTDNPDAQIDVTWALDNPVVLVDLHETLATPDANHLTITIHFSVTRGAEMVSVDGTIAVVVSPQTVTANLAITVNGTPYAVITGTNAGIQVRHADGSDLSADERQALSDLFNLPDALEIAIESLFNPCQHLMGA